jgi:hypothetical protein
MCGIDIQTRDPIDLGPFCFALLGLRMIVGHCSQGVALGYLVLPLWGGESGSAQMI